MESFRGHLHFALIVCGLLVSPTWGFASTQHCASLYKAAYFGGGELEVTDGSSFSDLEEEYLPSKDGWKLTSSFQVTRGCTLRACNESYFAGECRDFTQSSSGLPNPFENILSVSCSCQRTCSCEDVNNIRRNSCARIYVSEGGCNSCSPSYRDIKKGQSQKHFEHNVTSLVVRPGCQLTVYDEPQFHGESRSVENITERWTLPVRSFACSCESESEVPAHNLHEIPSNNSNYPPQLVIPDSLDEITAMMNGEFGRHPGLLASLRSNGGKRNTKNAYILLFGTSGAGKSSAMNMLFNNPNVTLVNGAVSKKGIHEFRIPVPVDELGIRNSELRVIDTPGLGSTEEADARLLATLEEFLDGHEELKDRIPNVVLIFHKFTDNRFTDEGSSFAKMLRGLDSFRGRLTDQTYSNVIFVFSHFMSEALVVTRNPKMKLSALRKMIEESTRFPRPILLAVAENKPEEKGLHLINGNYKLPNGDFYPKNLFNRITQVTRGGGDPIGNAVIRSAFGNPDSFNVPSSNFAPVESENSKIPKYLGILSNPVSPVERTGPEQMQTTKQIFTLLMGKLVNETTNPEETLRQMTLEWRESRRTSEVISGRV